MSISDLCSIVKWILKYFARIVAAHSFVDDKAVWNQIDGRRICSLRLFEPRDNALTVILEEAGIDETKRGDRVPEGGEEYVWRSWLADGVQHAAPAGFLNEMGKLVQREASLVGKAGFVDLVCRCFV